MRFQAIRLGHGQHADWSRITHVRVKVGAAGDTAAGQRVLDHIRSRADQHGIAAITAIEADFPARKTDLPHPRGMQVDLRHLANDRNAGSSAQDKGLLELGWLE
ncbi:MAG: hypothetical protein ACK47B_20675 [Armatimonadota bacterium]